MDKELLLSDKVQDFISLHLNDDIPSLILKRSNFPGYPVEAIANQIISKRKAEKKLPSWYNTKKILYPPSVSIEQSSSEVTARYKAEMFSGNTALDLTGGFGVDSYYLSLQSGHLDYVEANLELAEIATHNFKLLGRKNVTVHNLTAEEFLSKTSKTYDLIYLDPDRRPGNTRVRGFEESSPNLLEILPKLKSCAKNIFIKASPMIDISLAIKQIGDVYQTIILAVDNEVKELLFWITEEGSDTPSIKCVNLTRGKTEVLETEEKSNSQEECTYENISDYLYEPNASIMKAGVYGVLCKGYKVKKLSKNTHLFTSDEPIADFPGRGFRVIGDITYKKKSVQSLLDSSKVNVSTRNFNDSPDQLKSKLGLVDGGNQYLFGYRDINNQPRIAVCTKLVT